jgi:fructokinase
MSPTCGTLAVLNQTKEAAMILVCGEALMDVFDGGATHTGNTLDARIGGSPYNVAMGLARLAQPVAFCGAVSSGFMGERLVRSMTEEGIDTRCVQRVDAPSSVCIVGLDAQGVPRYDFYGERGADRHLTHAALRALPAETKAVHVGSYAMVVEPVAAVQRALVEQQRATCLISYDPNVRLVVEPSLERWRETLAWMAPRVHLLKVSEEDLGLLYPGHALSALAQSWISQGVHLVVITRGQHGSIAFHASGSVQADSPKVDVIDTVGAGDTFQAALLTWLAEQERLSAEGLATLTQQDIAQALRFAAEAAAITCSRRGADLPLRSQLPA